MDLYVEHKGLRVVSQRTGCHYLHCLFFPFCLSLRIGKHAHNSLAFKQTARAGRPLPSPETSAFTWDPPKQGLKLRLVLLFPRVHPLFLWSFSPEVPQQPVTEFDGCAAVPDTLGHSVFFRRTVPPEGAEPSWPALAVSVSISAALPLANPVVCRLSVSYLPADFSTTMPFSHWTRGFLKNLSEHILFLLKTYGGRQLP